jgi:glycosyltransferase involved in cell wall biosynthesis
MKNKIQSLRYLAKTGIPLHGPNGIFSIPNRRSAILNICHVASFYPEIHTVWGGAEQACKRTIEMLKESGVTQTLVTLPKQKEAPLPVPYYPVVGVESRLPRSMRETILGIKVVLFPYDPIDYWKCLALFRSIKPDVVHLHNFKYLTFGVVSAARRLGIPLVYSVYDYWLFCPRESLFRNTNVSCIDATGIDCIRCYRPKGKNPSVFFKLPLLFRRRFVNHFIRRIQRYIVLSQSSKDILVRHGVPADAVEIIHQYLDLRIAPDAGLSIEPDTVFFAGWLSPNKGAHIFIQAAAQVARHNPQARFYMAGGKADESFHQSLLAMIKEGNLEGRLTILGKVGQPEIRKRLQASEIVVIPEQWENMSPLFLTEAMAWGKAIVASRIGGLAEFINDGENGFAVTPASPEAFADKIHHLLSHKDLARAMGARAKADVVRFFDPADIREKTMQAYQKLIVR